MRVEVQNTSVGRFFIFFCVAVAIIRKRKKGTTKKCTYGLYLNWNTYSSFLSASNTPYSCPNLIYLSSKDEQNKIAAHTSSRGWIQHKKKFRALLQLLLLLLLLPRKKRITHKNKTQNENKVAVRRQERQNIWSDFIEHNFKNTKGRGEQTRRKRINENHARLGVCVCATTTISADDVHRRNSTL